MSIEASTLHAMQSVLGETGFIDEPKEMEKYLVAWRGGWRGKSPLIALPQSTEQLSDIVKICAQHRIGIVPQGGNTGTVGGCIPSAEDNQIVIALERMNKIRLIDKKGLTAIVESGLILQQLQTAADEADLLFPLSMASEGSAQVGGALSTNAGGTAVLRYGNMRNLVLGVEAVLADGAIYRGLKSLRKDNTGYNLAQYFAGAEGTLGIVTALSLRLFPKPRQVLTAIAEVKTAEAALELFGRFADQSGECLSAFELMSQEALAFVIKNIPGSRLPSKPAPYSILIEMTTTSPSVPLRLMFETVASEALEHDVISNAVIAESDQQRIEFWHLRENISEALRKEAAAIHFDISLPLAEIDSFLSTTRALIEAVAQDIVVAPFGHIGDGNLHYNMCFSQKPVAFEAIKQKIQDIVYGEVTRREGSQSAEHGIGTARKAVLTRYKSSLDIVLMKKIKAAFDPHGLMNPGKIFD